MTAAMNDSSRRGRLDRLRTIPLFEQLDNDVLAEILTRATEFEAQEGHVLVQPNQPGAGLFVIEEGSVTVELHGTEKNLEAGEFFGELALLLENERHTARVLAATPIKCLAIRRADFDELLEKNPSIAVSMLKTVAKRLAERG
jgi:CRP-like cAMP-binding protein